MTRFSQFIRTFALFRNTCEILVFGFLTLKFSYFLQMPAFCWNERNFRMSDRFPRVFTSLYPHRRQHPGFPPPWTDWGDVASPCVSYNLAAVCLIWNSESWCRKGHLCVLMLSKSRIKLAGCALETPGLSLRSSCRHFLHTSALTFSTRAPRTPVGRALLPRAPQAADWRPETYWW